MEERDTGIAFNDALNKPKTKLGLDWRLLLACLGVALLVLLTINALLGFVLLFALPVAARRFVKKDAKIFRLWAASFYQYGFYTPSKKEQL